MRKAQEDVPSSHLERMDMRLISIFRLGALFWRKTGSVEKIVPISKQIRFFPHEVVGTDIADVFR